MSNRRDFLKQSSALVMGVNFLGMSCTVDTLMLEGISRKYVLKLKKK
jgi:hypothetical protein